MAEIVAPHVGRWRRWWSGRCPCRRCRTCASTSGTRSSPRRGRPTVQPLARSFDHYARALALQMTGKASEARVGGRRVRIHARQGDGRDARGVVQQRPHGAGHGEPPAAGPAGRFGRPGGCAPGDGGRRSGRADLRRARALAVVGARDAGRRPAEGGPCRRGRAGVQDGSREEPGERAHVVRPDRRAWPRKAARPKPLSSSASSTRRGSRRPARSPSTRCSRTQRRCRLVGTLEPGPTEVAGSLRSAG